MTRLMAFLAILFLLVLGAFRLSAWSDEVAAPAVEALR